MVTPPSSAGPVPDCSCCSQPRRSRQLHLLQAEARPAAYAGAKVAEPRRGDLAPASAESVGTCPRND